MKFEISWKSCFFMHAKAPNKQEKLQNKRGNTTHIKNTQRKKLLKCSLLQSTEDFTAHNMFFIFSLSIKHHSLSDICSPTFIHND